MSTQNALHFIRRVRREPQLVAAIPPAELAEQLPALGHSLGCEFTLDELQAAFAHDWAMRWQIDQVRMIRLPTAPPAAYALRR